jgi:poly(3-hydroxybutyrate) depolymerase
MEMPVWILLAVLVGIALAAPRYGVDSRLPAPGELAAPRPRHRVRDDVAALVRAARQVLHPHRPRV